MAKTPTRFDADLKRAGLTPSPKDRAAAAKTAAFLAQAVQTVEAYLKRSGDDATD